MNKPTKYNTNESYLIEPFFLSAKPAGIEFTANINDEFVHPKQFESIVYAMDNASEDDSFTLNLTTVGGRLDAVLPLLGAMENTKAHIHVHACSDVASAGTFLLMRAHSVSMNDYVTVMCHQVSFGSAGEGWNVEKHVEHTLKSSKKLLRDMYKFFFSEEELDRMCTGTPYYMDRDEFVERYTRRAELYQQEMEAANKPQKKPSKKKPVDTQQK